MHPDDEPPDGTPLLWLGCVLVVAAVVTRITLTTLFPG